MSGDAAMSDGTLLHLPDELGDLLRGPTVMVEHERGGVFLSTPSPQRLAKRLAKRRRFRLAKRAGTAVKYSLPPGRYRVVNYDPRFYLMPDQHEIGGDAASRELSWASEHDYHEHLNPASQDADARWFSDWFARFVVAPARPKRVLELGCGAGRNLAAIQTHLPHVEAVGVEINPEAVETARKTTDARIVLGSLYDIGGFGEFDLAYTCGVLMHVPHENVDAVVRAMTNLASRTAHFELHGTPHGFDFHRYPRDYGALYVRLGLGPARYEVFPRKDVRNRGESVGRMALLSYPLDLPQPPP